MKFTANVPTYELVYKRVKNLNLRVHPDGKVSVSAPKRVSKMEIDRFVSDRAQWIEKAKERIELRAKNNTKDENHVHDEAECMAFFKPYLERYFSLFEGVIPEKPMLKVRDMKSRWGVCHPGRGYITLNKRLLDKPTPAVEYVVLHELVHFLHPDHQAGFHNEMAKIMPDYKKRRAML